MKSAGRYEIQSPINTGAVDTYTARDPDSGATVLLHVLPPGYDANPKESFLQFAPGCPGKILDSGLDQLSQRSFVITEYPKDRKALLLWIKSLSQIAAKPPAPPAKAPAAAAAKPASAAPASDGATRMFDPAAVFGGSPAAAAAKPASAAPAAKPAAPPASDGATRMFDPAAIFGGTNPAAAKPAPAPAPPASDGATRMLDPAAIFGGSPASASPPAPAAPPAANDGATRMFDPAAVFGGGPAAPESQPQDRPAPPPKTPPPATHDSRPRTDPFADLKAALARSAGPQPAVTPAADPDAKKHGEFTQRFELAKEFRGAPLRVDHTRAPAAKSGAPGQGADAKGIFTLMMEAYAKKVADAEKPGPTKAPAPPADPPSANSDGATRMLDASALFGEVPPAAAQPPAPTETPKPSTPPAGYESTIRMPALHAEDDDDKKPSR